jgi:hypothetical protein
VVVRKLHISVARLGREQVSSQGTSVPSFPMIFYQKALFVQGITTKGFLSQNGHIYEGVNTTPKPESTDESRTQCTSTCR